MGRREVAIGVHKEKYCAWRDTQEWGGGEGGRAQRESMTGWPTKTNHPPCLQCYELSITNSVSVSRTQYQPRTK